MKNIKGVTLIALIVTIIVLLIITGVSVSITINEDGLIEQAQTAVIKTEQHNALEEVSDAWAKVASEYYSKWANETKSEYFSEDKLAAKLNPYLTGEVDNETGVKYDQDNKEYTITYKKDNQDYIIIIDKNGNARITE